MDDLAPEDLQWLTPQDDDPKNDDGGFEGVDRDSEAVLPAGAGSEFTWGGVEDLRGAFVDAFNARDLDGVLELVAEDVEFGDPAVEGRDELANELADIWQRSPGVLLTRAFDGDTPCAVAWRPDEDGSWVRAALVCFDAEDDVITALAIPDDPEALEAAVTEDPRSDEPEVWLEWDNDAPPGDRAATGLL